MRVAFVLESGGSGNNNSRVSQPRKRDFFLPRRLSLTHDPNDEGIQQPLPFVGAMEK